MPGYIRDFSEGLVSGQRSGAQISDRYHFFGVEQVQTHLFNDFPGRVYFLALNDPGKQVKNKWGMDIMLRGCIQVIAEIAEEEGNPVHKAKVNIADEPFNPDVSEKAGAPSVLRYQRWHKSDL